MITSAYVKTEQGILRCVTWSQLVPDLDINVRYLLGKSRWVVRSHGSGYHTAADCKHNELVA